MDEARVAEIRERDDAAYRTRLVWAERLLKDVIATLGMDAATVWWRNHNAALKQNLAAVQREWDEEKRRLAPPGNKKEGK